MFNPKDLMAGQHMVVGDCNGIKMEDRWKNETPIFTKIILEHMGKAKTVLDYGCGVGRLAKDILEMNRDIDKLIGVDTSQDMLDRAKDYVLSDRFEPKLVSDFDEKVDFTYCVYVLQHIPAVELRDSIRQLARSSSTVFIVNSDVRMAVNGESFQNDGVDVISELSREFKNITWGMSLKDTISNQVVKTMFFNGQIRHYTLLCKNEK